MVEKGRLRHKATNKYFHVEIEQETDGRWLAEVTDLAGVMVYGASKEDVIHRAKILALRVLADRLEHDEIQDDTVDLFSVVHA